MPETRFIDLHPDKIHGNGPEPALLACRRFLEDAVERGWPDVRIITGLGIHGDGVPRLRSRVERDVLPSFFSRIESQEYEQGGAVIRLVLKPGPVRHSKKQLEHLKKTAAEKDRIAREERLMVAEKRLDAAEGYYDEGDLRRAALKLNQVVKEFFPEMGKVEGNEEKVAQAIKIIKKKLEVLG